MTWSTRRPKNEAEGECYDLLRSEGYEVTKRGWPDFFCWKDGEFITVEVKRTRHYALKTHQAMVLEALAACGIGCYRWSPDAGFQQIKG